MLRRHSLDVSIYTTPTYSPEHASPVDKEQYEETIWKGFSKNRFTGEGKAGEEKKTSFI